MPSPSSPTQGAKITQRFVITTRIKQGRNLSWRRRASRPATIKYKIICCWFFFALNTPLMAQSHWYVTTTGEFTAGTYYKHSDKRRMQKAKITMQADYLEKSSIILALGQANYFFKQSTSKWRENHYAGVIGHNLFCDYCQGKFTTTLLMLNIADDIADWNSVAAALSFTNYRGTLLTRLGFAASKYSESDSSRNINQITPSISLNLWQKRLWFSLKSDYISYGNKQYLNFQPTLSYITSYSRRSLLANKLAIGAIWGDSRYKFDFDSLLAYNTGDLLRSTYFVSFVWDIFDNTHLNLSAGRENFQDVLQQQYNLNYFIISFLNTW